MIEYIREIGIASVLVIQFTIIGLSSVDLFLTYYYVKKYKKWQPNKPYKLIELNPLLVFLWNKFGLYFGMFIGSLIILTIQAIIVIYAHWSIVVLDFIILIFTLNNHFKNINLLNELMKKYPSGHLSENIFGYVEGNN